MRQMEKCMFICDDGKCKVDNWQLPSEYRDAVCYNNGVIQRSASSARCPVLSLAEKHVAQQYLNELSR
jgi:hypothetical protein